MTIEYEGSQVYGERRIKPKGSMLGALFGGPHLTEIVMKPDPKGEHDNDQVGISASYGSYTVKGRDINYNSTLIEHRVSWRNY